MQGGTSDPGTTRRTRRPLSITLALAGMLTAIALIAGGLTGLGRDVLPNDGWATFDGRNEDGVVLLAPAEQPPAASAPDRADRAAVAPDDVAPPALAPRADPPTGGTAAPRERSVPAEYEPPAGERRDGDDSQTGVRAAIDTDRDGLTDVKEERLGTDALSRDSDGDQLPDGWEQEHGLNPMDIRDGDGDGDGDGLRNRTEFRVMSDPRTPDTDANGRPDGEDDTDGDGLSNGVEDDLQATDPTSGDTDGDGVGDGAGDQDGDGVSNATEVAQGTDPTAPDAPAPEPGPAPAPAPDAAPAAAPADPPASTPAPAQSLP